MREENIHSLIEQDPSVRRFSGFAASGECDPGEHTRSLLAVLSMSPRQGQQARDSPQERTLPVQAS